MKKRTALILVFALMAMLLSGCNVVESFLEDLKRDLNIGSGDESFSNTLPGEISQNIQIYIDENGNFVYIPMGTEPQWEYEVYPALPTEEMEPQWDYEVYPTFPVEETEPVWEEATVPPMPEEIIISIDETYDDYLYRVPQINLSSPDAQRINQMIMDTVGITLDDVREAAAEGYSTGCYSLNWSVEYSSPERFALMTIASYDGGSEFHKVYSFDLSTQTQVTNAQILEEFDLSEDAFVSLAKEAVVRASESAYGPFVGDAEYYEKLEISTSDEKINPDMAMFVDEDGQLCIITTVGSIAGASFYERILRVC